MRLSIEKFAFVGHCMAVCLASLAPLSSWVGVQIGYIAGAYEQLGAAALGGAADPFIGFLATVPFRFFPLCMLVFVVLTTVTGTSSCGPCHASASAWLPADAAITPSPRCAALSERMALRAPRSLNEPVNCICSVLR